MQRKRNLFLCWSKVFYRHQQTVEIFKVKNIQRKSCISQNLLFLLNVTAYATFLAKFSSV